MPGLTPRSLVVVIVCLIGIGIGVVYITERRPAAPNQQCRKGLVVVEPQPDAPIRISLMETNCPDPYFANVSFKTETTGSRPVSRYDVRMRASHAGITDSYSTVVSGFGTVEPEDPAFSQHQDSSEFIGVTLNRGLFRAPVDELKLSVWSVTFKDGTIWNRASTTE